MASKRKSASGKNKPIKKLEPHEGYFGNFGGRYVSDLLIPALDELTAAWKKFSHDKKFEKELLHLYNDYAGRPSLLTYAENLSHAWNAQVYLKREDLLHTGSHKINNTLGQALLAQKMKKGRIIAETGAGQHGVATATAGALLKIPVHIYMGTEDLRRQALNDFRMRLLGATISGVGGNSGTLRDAVNEALRDWAKNVDNTYYLIGSAIGPHPYPTIVRTFQSIIGKESRQQFTKITGKLPQAVFACVGGGSNAIGMFSGFLKDTKVELIGAEAGGRTLTPGNHSASLTVGKPGVLQGAMTYILQTPDGQVNNVHSVSAGLDYPGVGPEHAYLKEQGRAQYVAIKDKEALAAFQELSKTEGIIPALESAHAVAAAKQYVDALKKKGKKNPLILICLSGRGDKDVQEVERLLALPEVPIAAEEEPTANTFTTAPTVKVLAGGSSE
ncbi:MAG: Tryptophan synthase beta chain [Turneriella sp.]|nr:Tryptophan synthase beta chain [Turneriella sp.]